MNILMGEALSWNSPVHTGSHHYAKQFVKHGYNVFWLGGTLHFLNILGINISGANKANDIISIWRNNGININDKLKCYHPLTLLPYRNYPFLKSNFVMKRTLYYTIPSIHAILKKNGYDYPDILWLSQSHSAFSLFKLMKYKKLIYRLSDDYIHFLSVPKNTLAAEKEIIQKADVIFVTSHHILNYVKKIRTSNIFYLPNGVDYDNFYQKRKDEPMDIKKISHPRIIYVGSIKEWFDVNLIYKCAKSLHQFSFILIGEVETNLSILEKLKNVYIIGPRRYKDIPLYLRYSDVAIIPFIKNTLTNAINPVKLFEYFAAGLPVVSTNLEEIKLLKSPAILACNFNEFIKGIQKALKSGKNKTEYHNFAKNNTWEARYKIIADKVGI